MLSVTRFTMPKVVRSVPVRGLTTRLSGVATPVTVSPLKVGIATVAGLGIVGIAGYGAMHGNSVTHVGLDGTVAEDGYWTSVVRTRVRDAFAYFGLGVGVSAWSAATAFRSAAVRSAMYRSPIMFAVGGFAASIGSMYWTMATPATNTYMKLLSFTAFTATMGLTLAPMGVLGGPLLLQAAGYTAGLVGSLALVGATAPSGSFYSWSAPLSIGLGGLVVASLGSMFFPGIALLQQISLYGGTVLFSAFVVHDTNKLIARAETLPEGEFDACNSAVSIYLDSVNLFVRIATILAQQKSK